MQEIKEQFKKEVRPPIVVVMGHVDHGKSSILEAIRKDFQITSKESGGITQHIGAYEVEHQGKKITFLDTPGHKAFSSMRTRGAKLADVAILVVAADDGVKPQTKEVIEQATQAKLPIVVVINKIDTPGANVQRMKNELAQNNVLLEDMGGKVPFVETSAATGKGIPELLDMIILVAEMEELTAPVEGPASGLIIESSLDAQRGPATTLLVKEGMLSLGDVVGTSSAFGKVRILEDFQGNDITTAIPSMPVKMLGFESPAQVGEEFAVFENMEEARENLSQKGQKEQDTVNPEAKIVNIVLKADVQGSLEAVVQTLEALSEGRIVFKLVKAETGDIIENDVKFARGAKARIFGFRTRIAPAIAELAEREGVTIETFEVIYELVKRAEQLLKGSLETKIVIKHVGSLRILAVFRTDKRQQIVGGEVFKGEARKGADVEIFRNEEMIGKGKITGLQKNKKETSSVSQGEEAGLFYEGEEKIKEGDVLEFYVKETETQ